MKKILVSLAVALFATVASASVAGSSHDLGGSVCGFCHVAHWATAGVGAPLWAPARALPASTDYTNIHGTGTLDSRNTLTCLSCHTTAATYGTGATDAVSAIGTDMSNDHPVGSAAVLDTSAGFQVPSWTSTGMTWATGTAIGCAHCHDVHNESAEVTATPYKLVRGGLNGFCTACHTK